VAAAITFAGLAVIFGYVRSPNVLPGILSVTVHLGSIGPGLLVVVGPIGKRIARSSRARYSERAAGIAIAVVFLITVAVTTTIAMFASQIGRAIYRALSG
jgi:hypothetical protein